jgi:hypothetical protein
MFKSSNQKLREACELVAGVIAGLDTLLVDARQVRRLNFSRDGMAEEPDYVRQLDQQRERLLTVAAALAEMRLEWSHELDGECDGESEEDASSS